MLVDSSGSFLYVLDKYIPQKPPATSSLLEQSDAFLPDPTTPGLYPVGDLTAFSVDTNTGRLSLITNTR